ncbi:conserved hypothetical lipoprotein [Mycoplasmoides gallisepticum NC08_2008.031-4-3P]|uniref:Conserved hypothetical lipoprotein n=2 Tax=Mycoplasmoides gallisepticum TaxID=2096 RepID=J3T9A9_MYCGL|nr:MG321/MPN456 family lipoprotein [Mycoplasmoides gallisepticum]AFP77607.1 conserved hypothetical lipoprotein [Mycoplasmoides gallisepticum NC96_1596-4-2P]AFP78374.1 conserved hypothetical lipoprotein [Mycoplasmoides gallisepticum NY01_2001.047-5-1P]AFP79134.1 conserved hypothetical lipoprotein [Mycoplasmoides gallisepticum WI01_2001.043-13-2P]AFP79880.1 conserved hypothetical lipoprotein [Mycoplasmoides gallisepticum NC06_2006.080-5-2P]AFP81387.1 conserved hypothetical lipoprotein [Mycoplasm
MRYRNKTIIKLGSLLSFAVLSTSALASCVNNSTNNDFARGYVFENNDNVKIKAADGIRDLALNKESFVKALENMGATKANPWRIIDKSLSITSLTDDQRTMINNKTAALRSLSDGLIEYDFRLRGSTTPSVSEYFLRANTTAGTYFWTVDYPAVGSFIEGWIANTKGAKVDQYLVQRIIDVANNPAAYVQEYTQQYVDLTASLAKAIIKSNLTQLKAPTMPAATEGEPAQSSSASDMDYLNLFKGKTLVEVLTTNQTTLDNFQNSIGKYLGEWTASNTPRALYLNSFLDDQFSFIPLPSSNNTTINHLLVKSPEWKIRTDWKAGELLLRDSNGPANQAFVSELPENPAEGKELALQKAFSAGNTSNFPGSFSYLISSETTGEINYDANTRTRTSNLTGTYKLEGAKGVKLYDANDKLLAVVLRPTTGTGAEMWAKSVEAEARKENSDVYISTTGVVDPEVDSNLQKYIDQAVRYDWLIDHNVKWTDQNGNPVASLSGRDFERGLESFWLAAGIDYTVNGYLLDLLGVDLEKSVNGTVANGENGKVTVTPGTEKITSSTYDIGKFTSTDDTFRIYLKQPYAFAMQTFKISFLTPMPYWDTRVRALRISGQADSTVSNLGTTNTEFKTAVSNNWTESAVPGEIMVNADSSIDKEKTGWTKLFGYISASDSSQNLNNAYYSGSYYLSAYSANQFTQTYNPNYQKAFSADYYANKTPVQKAITNFGGKRSADIIFQGYRDDDSSPTQLTVPRSSITSASTTARYRQFYWSSQVTTPSSQMNYTVWAASPQGGEPEYQDAVTRKIFRNWNSDDSRIIRAGIVNLINWYRLAQVVQSRGTFQYTSIPYRSLTDNTLFATVPLHDAVLAIQENKLPAAFKVNGYSGSLRRPYSDFQPTRTNNQNN